MNQAVNIAAIEHFAQEGYLSDAQHREYSSSLGSSSMATLKSLLVRGVVPELTFAETLSSLYQLELLGRLDLPLIALPEATPLSSFLQEHEVLPLSIDDTRLQLAVCDPSDEFVVQVLRAKLGVEVETKVALRSHILEALEKLYKLDKGSAKAVSSDIPDDLENQSSLVRNLHRLLQRAISIGASDIHFEPVEQALRVRFRVHGLLRDVHQFDVEQSEQIIARLKLMAKLDVTERRLAQNGRFKFPAEGKLVDLRVSTLPLHNGESIVLRLLEFDLSRRSLSGLGFNKDIASGLEQAISSQQGLILVTGPTGSGKSTTLYCLLNRLNTPERKLISVEDPVELNISGVNQIQVDEEHGIGFSQALKSVLRQDPDVVMVGEIRDAATAQLAAQAALTGHLVLCTLHTASAASAVTRLQNLGLPDYLVSATVKAVLAQRLVRCVCQECQASAEISECRSCDGSGYNARTTIAEFLSPEALADALRGSQISEADLATRYLNGVSLEDDALRILNAGITDQNEVFRVLGTQLNV